MGNELTREIYDQNAQLQRVCLIFVVIYLCETIHCGLCLDKKIPCVMDLTRFGVLLQEYNKREEELCRQRSNYNTQFVG